MDTKQISPGTWWMWRQSFDTVYVGPVEVVKVTKAQIRLARSTSASGYRTTFGVDVSRNMFATRGEACEAASAWLRRHAEALRQDAADTDAAARALLSVDDAKRASGHGWEVYS